MRRRTFLKTTGLALSTNTTTLRQESAGQPVIRPETDVYRQFLRRLPARARIPDERYDATVGSRFAERHLVEPALVGGCDAQFTLVAPQVMVSVGLGDIAGHVGPTSLVESGYRRVERPCASAVYVRQTRHRCRIASVSDTAVVVGTGPELKPVERFVRAIAAPADTDPLPEREPAVARVLDRLESGATLSVSPYGAPTATSPSNRPHAPRPLATGQRLTLEPSPPRLLTVAVYTTRVDRDRAYGSVATATASVGDGHLSRDGRLLAFDRPVPEQELVSNIEDD